MIGIRVREGGEHGEKQQLDLEFLYRMKKITKAGQFCMNLSDKFALYLVLIFLSILPCVTISALSFVVRVCWGKLSFKRQKKTGRKGILSDSIETISSMVNWYLMIYVYSQIFSKYGKIYRIYNVHSVYCKGLRYFSMEFSLDACLYVIFAFACTEFFLDQPLLSLLISFCFFFFQ